MSDNHTSKESERKLGVSMLVTLTFSAYVLLAVLSTTDMMLLREGAIALPVIQVGVSVIEFYRIAPLLILLLHFNLLAKLTLYAREIYDSNSSSQALRGAQGLFCKALIVLSSFEPKRLILEMKNENFTGVFIRLIFLIIFGTIPLIVLLIIQARFLAYQDVKFTFYHQFLITFDLFFQFVFMLNFYKLITAKKKFLLVPLLIEGIINFKRVIRTIRVILVGLVFFVSPLLFVWGVALVPDSSIEETIKFDLRRSVAGCFVKDWWNDYTSSCTIIESIEGERFINIQNETIALREPPPEIVGAVIHTKGDLNPKIPCEHVGVLNLNERSLNYANFSNSKFKCVEMEGTQLYGSNLEGVDLSGINLQKADLRGVKLSKTILSAAKLSHANLSKAKLRKADLSDAYLDGTDLSGAYLFAANLIGANLYGANLAGAMMVSVELKEASMIGAGLIDADLYEVNLDKSDLSGANLSRAKLDSTSLKGANLYGARLYRAQLNDITLEGAKLCGANFSDSTPRDTSLGNIDGEKPESWDDILNDIKIGLKKMGYLEKVIDVRLAEIKCICNSELGYVPPTGVNHCGL